MTSAAMELKRYRKRPGNEVIAVQLNLETRGFDYRKWGADQRCKKGDWLVNNNGDIYTVDAESFAQTYREVQPGSYLKFSPVWARKASKAGKIVTKDGATHFQAGDFIVYNDPDGKDGYAVSAAKFEEMYEPLE